MPCVPWLQIVQEVKALRTAVTQRERERAERATLVQQESLIKAKVCSPSSAVGQSLPDAWLGVSVIACSHAGSSACNLP